MNQLSQEILEFAAFLEQAPNHLAKALQAVVFRNVEEYLDSLENISPEEEIRMLNRSGRQQEQTENRKYRERLNAFKTENRELRQKVGDDVVDEHVLQNPLRAALVDESILQLFQMGEEIGTLIKNQKIDGPSLTQLAERAVTRAIQDDHLPEVRRKLSELTQYVVERSAETYYKENRAKIETFVEKTVTASIKSTT